MSTLANKERGLRGLTGMVAGAALLAASATGVSAAQLRILLGYYSDATQAVFDGMAADYMAAHPEDEVKVEVIPWDNLQQRLTTDIAGGTAPDIAMIGTRWLVDYVKNDIAEPLDLPAEFTGGFIDAFMAPSTFDGKLYGLPVAASARAMYYNKDLLAKAGVSEPPATWADVVAAAEKVKALGDDGYGFALQGKEIETDSYWYYALWSHGGAILDENGKSGVASPAAVEALTLYKSMIDQGLTQPDPTGSNRQDIERLFKQGRVAMLLSGPWMRGQMKTDAPTINYGIASIPMGTEKATYGVTDTLMVFKSSPNKELAVKFLTETAFSPKWRIEFSSKEGFLPVMKEEAAAPVFANDPELKVFVEMLPFARFAPPVANWEQMVDAVISALQNVYVGQVEPEAALKAAAATVDNLIQN